jgi:hypothetical protein
MQLAFLVTINTAGIVWSAYMQLFSKHLCSCHCLFCLNSADIAQSEVMQLTLLTYHCSSWHCSDSIEAVSIAQAEGIQLALLMQSASMQLALLSHRQGCWH